MKQPILAIALLAALPLACFAEDAVLQVMDLRGAAIAGAHVEVRSRERVWTGVTNREGTLIVPVPYQASIRIHYPGFEPVILQTEEQNSGSIAVRLRPAAIHTTIEVRVRDEEESAGPIERTALQIERGGARTVYDAIDRIVPGIHVTRRGVMGYGLNSPSGSISIRGIGGTPNTQIQIVVDGRPDYMGLMGHPLPDFYTLSDVGSLTVTQGPASVLYGSGAMGGVIEIKPTPVEGAHSALTTGFGSFSTGVHRLVHTNRLGRAHYRIAAGAAHTSGDRENSAYHGQDGTLGFGYDFTQGWKASLQGRYGHFSVEDPGPVSSPVSGHFAKVGRGGFNLALDNSGAGTWGATNFFSSYGHHMLWDGFRSTDSSRGLRHSQNLVVTPRLSFNFGVDLMQFGGKARNIKSELDYGEHEITDAGGFYRVSYAASGTLILNAGLRASHNSTYGAIMVPEAGALVRLSDKYSVSAAIGEGYRNPTIRELYLFPAPNPSLKPERLWNAQGTFHMRPAASITAWITGYYADAGDLIVTTGRWPSISLQNTGRTINRGVEANVTWQAARRIGVAVGYAGLRATNPAPYVPNSKLNCSVDVDAGRFFVGISGQYVGPRWADVQQSLKLERYALVSINMSLPLSRHARAFAAVENITNRKYEVVAGYPMPGFAMSGGLKVIF